MGPIKILSRLHIAIFFSRFGASEMDCYLHLFLKELDVSNGLH